MKHFKILLAGLGMLALIGVAVYGAKAQQQQPQGQQEQQNVEREWIWVDADEDVNKQKIVQLRNELTVILNKYGITPENPKSLSKEEWTSMQGEIYDLMKKYDLDPGKVLGRGMTMINCGMMMNYGAGMMWGKGNPSSCPGT